jgi:hypothetical protein
MYYFGLFLTSVVGDVGQAALDDLDMFPFPAMGTSFDAEMAIEAPMEGFVLTRNSPTLAEDLDNAKALMEFFGQGPTQAAMATAWGVIAPSGDAGAEGYSALQRRGGELVRSAKRAAQFLDRDTDRGFASRVGTLLQDFLDRPEQDLGAFLEQIQAAWSA